MNWFEGEISEAVAASKEKNAIFVVYIEGDDGKSTEMGAICNNSEISAILNSDQFVVIRIRSESLAYQQFSQIYNNAPIPSIYFIGRQGTPLEVIKEVGDVTKSNLNAILQKGAISTSAGQTQSLLDEEKASSSSNTPVSSNEPTISSEPISLNDTSTVDKPTDEDRAKLVRAEEEKEKARKTAEEKIERAKEIVEKKRLEKEHEEKELEKQKELERRKMGQDVQQLKQWQEEQDLKNMLEERQREKRESQAARARVLAQIAQDKEERASKFGASPPQPIAPPSAPVSTSQPGAARLQLRLPDGSTATCDFSGSDPLECVHAHIRANLRLPFVHYTLSTTFPRREFTEGDKTISLFDLGLVPTAVILILPLNRGAVQTQPGGGLVSNLVWTFLAPIFTILGYLKGFVFGAAAAPPTRNDGGNKRTAGTSQAGNSSPKASKVRKVPGESTVVRRQGNIHGLSNRTDSDEENNTWNGNSTQQM